MQTNVLAVSSIEDLAFGFHLGRCQQERLHNISNEIKITTLISTAEDLNRLAFDEVTNPDTEKRLTGIFDTHAGAISICQTQRAGPDFVNIVVEQMIPFSG